MKAVIQNTVLSQSGSVAVAGGATVTITDAETGTPASVFLDRAGASPISNTFAADAEGFFRVYVDPGRVNIEITSGTYTQTLLDIPVFETGFNLIDALPSQAGNDGKFLQTNGAISSWQEIPGALPDQSGQGGNVLSTDGSTPSWIPIPAGGGRTPIVTPLDLTVGPTGNYLTLNAALQDLSLNYHPTFINNTVRAILNLQLGYVISEQLVFDGVDMSWVQINSSDTTVPIARSALTNAIDGGFPFIAAINNARSAHLNFIGVMDATGAATDRHGLYVARGGSITGNTFGVQNAGGNGAFCNGSGSIASDDLIDVRNAGFTGAYCKGGGSIACAGTINASGSFSRGSYCQGGGEIAANIIDNSSAADYGAYCYGGGRISCSGSMDNSGANYPAITFGGGEVQCGGAMNNSGAGVYGAHTLNGGTISCGSSMDNSNAAFIGAHSFGGGLIHSGGMNNTGAGTNGALCRGNGSIGTANTMDNRKSVSDDPTDTVVLDGGRITRFNGTGGTNITTGILNTDDGYINR